MHLQNAIVKIESLFLFIIKNTVVSSNFTIFFNLLLYKYQHNHSLFVVIHIQYCLYHHQMVYHVVFDHPSVDHEIIFV